MLSVSVKAWKKQCNILIFVMLENIHKQLNVIESVIAVKKE